MTVTHIAERRGTDLYEPVFDLETNWVVGVESLTRDSGPPRGSDGIAPVHAALDSLPAHTFVAITLDPDAVAGLPLLLNGQLDRVLVHLDDREIGDPAELARRLIAFRHQGGRLALDVSLEWISVARLAALRPEVIEINASVTDGIDTDRSRRARAIELVALGERIGARIEAQGIATPGELASLRGMGVAYGRGLLLAEPFPLGELAPDVPPLDAA